MIALMLKALVAKKEKKIKCAF